MADFPFDIVGFDLDGTLLETHRDLGAAVNHALALGGFAPVPAEHAQDLIGGGAKIMLQRAIDNQGGLPDEEFRPLYKAMLAYYGAHNAVHTRPYPGVETALDYLAARGVKLADGTLAELASIMTVFPQVLVNVRGVERSRATDADVLVVITEWHEFRGLDPRRIKQSMRRPCIVDLRNIFDPEEMRGLGFAYEGVGRPKPRI